MPEVPAVTLAAWRLQLTALLLLAPGGYQMWSLTPGAPSFWVQGAGLLVRLLCRGCSCHLCALCCAWGLEASMLYAQACC